jgi:predicted dehydrogenase
MMRIGIIGMGFIGRTHLKAAKSVSGLECVGFVDPQARLDSQDLVGVRSFGSTDALAAEKIDGVVVSVPDEFHVPVTKQALALGLSVLLEKPAARNLQELVDLAGSAPDIGSRLLVAHQRRHHPAAQLTKKLLQDGGLGRLVGVGGVFALKKDDRYFVDRPRGVGLVNLIHDLDLLQHFCGRLAHVSATVSHAARGAKEEDTIALLMEFDSGVVGSMIATDTSPSPWGWDQATLELPSIPYNEAGTTYSLLGTTASLSVPDLNLFRHRDGEAWHQPLVHEKLKTALEDAYVNQLAHFVEVMKRTAAPIVGINEALATQAALEAVFISSREHRRISTQDLIDAAYADT